MQHSYLIARQEKRNIPDSKKQNFQTFWQDSVDVKRFGFLEFWIFDICRVLFVVVLYFVCLLCIAFGKYLKFLI